MIDLSRLTIFALMGLCLGCGPSPTLDASSEEAFGESVKVMTSDFKTEKAKFLASMFRIFAMGSMARFLEDVKTHELYVDYHGMTAKEIVVAEDVYPESALEWMKRVADIDLLSIDSRKLVGFDFASRIANSKAKADEIIEGVERKMEARRAEWQFGDSITTATEDAEARMEAIR